MEKTTIRGEEFHYIINRNSVCNKISILYINLKLSRYCINYSHNNISRDLYISHTKQVVDE